MKNFNFTLEHIVNGQVVTTSGNNTEFYNLIVNESDNQISVSLNPVKELDLLNAYIEYDYAFLESDKVYVNGYQSWTTSREYSRDDIQRGLNGISKRVKFAQKFTNLFGDYDFQSYSLKKGEFHSYSYTYIKHNIDDIELIATTSERSGFTIIHFDMKNNKIKLQKDVEGVKISQPYPLYDLVFINGKYEQVFSDYASVLELPKLKIDHLAGYTSWYNYYGNIKEEQLVRDLNSLSKVDEAKIFQVDDGYQRRVGEWLNLKTEKFPNGMKYIADMAHSNGLLAGIWIAPFNVQKKSYLVKENPDWFIKVPGKNKYQLGSIAWGGAYTLDFYNPEVKKYIKNFFDVILNDWGYDMVKLDFLYSVCLTPRHNKSRGQLMSEAMDFLRECVGDKYILGCGVPLFPAFGKVDLCRTGCDVAPNFLDGLKQKNTNQEIFNTQASMNNAIFRRHLNGKFFVNDPDVFYLRDSNVKKYDEFAVKKSKLKFTEENKEILANINNMCGSVLFVSDNVGGYDDVTLQKVKKYFTKSNAKVIDAEYIDDDNLIITYEEDNKILKLYYNNKTGKSYVK